MNIFSLSSMQKKIFLGSFIAVFILISFQLVGIRPPHILFSPVPQKVDPFDIVLPKLEQKENMYTLQKESEIVLVQKAEAETVTSYGDASSYTAIEFSSGKVIESKNLSMQVPIASLTKIMTAVVVMDLAEPEELFVVTKKAADKEPTKIGAPEGEKLSVKELLHAILLTSANDAAQVISDGVDAKYSKGTFVRAMNAKAKYMGLENTSFTNPQGFDNPQNYSTSEDLAVLSHYALTNYPLLAEIAAKPYEFLPADQNHKQFDLYNWNGLIGVYPNTSGLKIGNTDAAGRTTIVISERRGQKILAVMLGAPGILERDMWTADLLDNAFAKTQGLPPVKVTEEQLQEKYATWKYFE